MGRYGNNNLDYSDLHNQGYNIKENASLMIDQSTDQAIRKSHGGSFAMDMPR
jgi:hypothetical protein